MCQKNKCQGSNELTRNVLDQKKKTFKFNKTWEATNCYCFLLGTLRGSTNNKKKRKEDGVEIIER